MPTLFLKEVKCGELKYGRNIYDYEEGTLVFIGPGQVLGVNNDENYQPKG
jgi:AraC family transcriptional regulator, transcriptional activator of pobA